MREYILVSRITQTSSHKLINESIRTTNQLGCVILIRRQDQPDCQVITTLQQRITNNNPVQTKKKKESSRRTRTGRTKKPALSDKRIPKSKAKSK